MAVMNARVTKMLNAEGGLKMADKPKRGEIYVMGSEKEAVYTDLLALIELIQLHYHRRVNAVLVPEDKYRSTRAYCKVNKKKEIAFEVTGHMPAQDFVLQVISHQRRNPGAKRFVHVRQGTEDLENLVKLFRNADFDARSVTLDVED
jgi:hypothetical protein